MSTPETQLSSLPNNTEDTTSQMDNPNLPQVDNLKESQSVEDTFDKQLESYREGSSQNPFLVEMIIAAAYAGITYCGEMISAYHFLKKPIDPQRLLTDKTYKAQIERHLQLVRRHEDGKRIDGNNSKYSEIYKKTNDAVGQVNAIHEKQLLIKTSYTDNYLNGFKSAYGLNDLQAKAALSEATKKIKEDPTKSMHDALREEAGKMVKYRAEKEVKKELETDGSLRGFNKKQKEKIIAEKINERIGEWDRDFTNQTSTVKTFEDTNCQKLREDGVKQVADTLGVELKPVTKPATQAVTQQPITQLQAQIVVQPLPSSQPAPIITKAPHVLSKTPPRWLSSLNQVFSKIPTVFNISNAILNSAISKGKDLLFKSGSVLKSAITKLGGSLIKHAAVKLGLGVLTGGAATLISAGVDIARKIPIVGSMLDSAIRKTLDTALFIGKSTAIVLIAAVILIFFNFLSSNDQFQTNTPDNPLIIAQNPANQITAKWQNFESEYLLAEEQPKPTQIVEFSWKSFEKKQLLPGQNETNQMSIFSWKSFEREYITQADTPTTDN